MPKEEPLILGSDLKNMTWLPDPDTGEIREIRFVRIAPLLESEDGFLRAGAMNGHFNYNADKVSYETGLNNTEPSMTQQQFAEECDINTIVRRFGLTGQLPDNPKIPRYGDFTEVMDYQTALNAVRAAEEAFMALPADIRSEFANDPQRLLEAVEDPRNLDRLVELGLANPRAEVPEPVGKPPAGAHPDPDLSPPAPAKSDGKKHA